MNLTLASLAVLLVMGADSVPPEAEVSAPTPTVALAYDDPGFEWTSHYLPGFPRSPSEPRPPLMGEADRMGLEWGTGMIGPGVLFPHPPAPMAKGGRGPGARSGSGSGGGSPLSMMALASESSLPDPGSTPVPEPSTWLIWIGAGLLAWHQRHRLASN